MGYVAALFVGGKTVIGQTHADAFFLLNTMEKEGEISSGFLDPSTGRFVTDDFQFYIKKILVIRHAEAYLGTNPDITDFGRLQCQKAANFLLRLPIHQYVGFSCGCKRVYTTALAVFGQVGLPMHVSRRFCDPFEAESIDEFVNRLKEVIESLPECSVIISHSDFITNMAQMAMGTDITQCEQWKDKIPNCSITYVENHQPIWIGESPI